MTGELPAARAAWLLIALRWRRVRNRILARGRRGRPTPETPARAGTAPKSRNSWMLGVFVGLYLPVVSFQNAGRAITLIIKHEKALGARLAADLLPLAAIEVLSLTEIVNGQSGYWFHVIPRWFIFVQPLGFLIYLTAGVAETNRAPFDFPEAEQELVAGYHTEYSSMSFAMFFLAEYINMVTVSAVATNLFLGGWHGPFLPESLGWIWFLIKVAALLFFYVWMRWTLPRYRYDQLMKFGWKILLPIAVINLLVTAAAVLYFGA